MTRRREIKERIFQFLCRLGAHHVNRRRNARRLLIVMYHGLIEDHSPHPKSWLLLPVSRFKEQVDYLRRFYRILSVAEAVERIVRGERWRRPTACITFDDGYRNNLTLGLPILRRHNLPATIYLPTGVIGTTEVHWTILLERALAESSAGELNLVRHGLGTHRLNHSIGAAYEELKSQLYRVDDAVREAVLNDIFAQVSFNRDGNFDAFLPLTWDEVRYMHATRLIDFGGHTVRHQITSTLSEQGVREEVGGSMRAIAEQLGAPPRSFAYPNGTAHDFTEFAKRAVRESGGAAALTTVEGLNLPTADRFALRRVAVDSEMSLAEFKLLTSGLLPKLRKGRRPWPLRSP